jgi:hypothetical protein
MSTYHTLPSPLPVPSSALFSVWHTGHAPSYRYAYFQFAGSSSATSASSLVARVANDARRRRATGSTSARRLDGAAKRSRRARLRARVCERRGERHGERRGLRIPSGGR